MPHRSPPGTSAVQLYSEIWDRFTNRDLIVEVLAAVDSIDERLSDTQRALGDITARFNELETLVTAAQNYIAAALDSLDVQMGDLQTRLTADAEALRAAIAQANLAQEDEALLVSAADRIQATAVTVAGLAQPSAVADPETPDSAGPLEGDTTGGGPVAPADGGEPVGDGTVPGEPTA